MTSKSSHTLPPILSGTPNHYSAVGAWAPAELPELDGGTHGAKGLLVKDSLAAVREAAALF